MDTEPLPPSPEILAEELVFWLEILDTKGEAEVIARALKHFREKNGLGQRQAAAILGVDRTSISDWERRARKMQPEVKRHLLMTGMLHAVHLGIRVFRETHCK